MKKMYILIATIVALAAFLCIELYRSNSSIEVEEIEVIRADLPEGFGGYRIAHLSDLHGNQFGDDNVELCDLLRSLHVDIIVFTGDYVNDSGDIPMVFETAKNLVAVAPVYFVPGNHEYGDFYGNAYPEVERELKRAGVTVLRNQAVELENGGDALILLGVDDPNGNADMLSMSDTVVLARNREPEFLMMLNHRYDRADEAAALGVNVMLAGHAHGGLIRLPFTDGLVGPSRVLFPKNTNGLYEIDDMGLVVSRGLGNAGMSRRFFNKFHLPIITLNRG